jgi:hypothetical protein
VGRRHQGQAADRLGEREHPHQEDGAREAGSRYPGWHLRRGEQPAHPSRYVRPGPQRKGIAVERMLGIEVPDRAQWIRTMLAEWNRVLNHLMFTGSYPLTSRECSASVTTRPSARAEVEDIAV